MPAEQFDLFNIDEYPKGAFKPFHEKFTGRCTVPSSAAHHGDNQEFKVNLATGECDCKHGAAFTMVRDTATRQMRWLSNPPCVHKLKAMGNIIIKAKGALHTELMWAYVKALAARYNAYEVVSAFHKELRRADVRRAWYWANILATTRGFHGVVKYLHNILYEETRDHALGNAILDYMEAYPKSSPNVLEASKLVEWFCRSRKKWELLHRLEIFTAEMAGYQILVDEQGRDVAKGADIIDAKNYKRLVALTVKSVSPAVFQAGVKGIQKSKAPLGSDLQNMRADLLNRLIPRFDKDYASALVQTVARRGAVTGDYGYHDVNAVADAAGHGESPRPIYGVAKPVLAAINGRTAPLPFPLGVILQIPLYAQDNHTFFGKSLIKRFPGELKPGAVQTNLDLRWCGAYYGVAWRMQAFTQHGTCDVPWGSVVWDKKIIKTVENLWY